jgi:mannose-6-phosphate isomerase-like protein (cupin superfamily)
MVDYGMATPTEEASDTYPAGDGTHYDLKGVLDLEELRAQMWFFEPGGSSIYHLHNRQEELYYLVDGPAQMRVGRDDDQELVDVPEGTTMTVPPGTARQLLNPTDHATTWLVVAAPNVREAEIYHEGRDEFLPLEEFLALVEE